MQYECGGVGKYQNSDISNSFMIRTQSCKKQGLLSHLDKILEGRAGKNEITMSGYNDLSKDQLIAEIIHLKKRKLIEVFERKIQAKLAEIWGDNH
jgi:hypothetical protein